MKNTISFFAFAFVFFLYSCGGLEKEIDLELPVYESQIAVECYLEPGQPFILLLTKSAAYFDAFPTEELEFVESILEQEAEVTIRHKGVTYDLRNEIFFNPITNKVYNYFNAELVPEEFDNDFFFTYKNKGWA